MKHYADENIFLVEILGFTDHCDLRCSYCDWEKRPFEPLTRQELIWVKRHLRGAHMFIRRHYPAAQVIEYSGGEPYAHPEVVELVLEEFRDHWVRVNTNGLHLDAAALAAVRRHGRAYLAVSLDGHTLEANQYRFRTRRQLDRVVEGVDAALSSGIPVALLCTLHDKNTDALPAFLSWLEQRWPEPIREGRLMMAAHLLSCYAVPHPSAGKEQLRRLRAALMDTRSPVVAPIREHYARLGVEDAPCRIHQWAASMHFLGDALASTGRFASFRCGMRGVGRIGDFTLMEELERDSFSRAAEESRKTDFRELQCRCFVDWRAFDLIFSGEIPLERAKAWFAPLRDEKIQTWIQRRLEQ